jgi:hypothetical protein
MFEVLLGSGLEMSNIRTLLNISRCLTLSLRPILQPMNLLDSPHPLQGVNLGQSSRTPILLNYRSLELNNQFRNLGINAVANHVRELYLLES